MSAAGTPSPARATGGIPTGSTVAGGTPTGAVLVEGVDVLLLDLDGTVYRGGTAIDGAADAVRESARRGTRSAYVTNNASRHPSAIADQLTAAGIPTRPEDVVTSAQAGARLLASLVDPGTRTLVVGSAHLVDEVAAVGLVPLARDAPDRVGRAQAVVQGFDPSLRWSDLAAAAYALAAGVPWVATNVDLTIPTGDGIAPGNGSLVAAVAAAAGRRPVVAGKPERPLLDQAIERTGATVPLVVGDRLDTDIEAGVRAGLPTLLVLTGVSRPTDLVQAPARMRPTHLAADLAGLLEPALSATDGGDGAWRCGGWTVRVAGATSATSVSGSGDRVAGLWALAHACWAAADDGRAPTDSTGLAAALDRIGWSDGASR